MRSAALPIIGTDLATLRPTAEGKALTGLEDALAPRAGAEESSQPTAGLEEWPPSPSERNPWRYDAGDPLKALGVQEVTLEANKLWEELGPLHQQSIADLFTWHRPPQIGDISGSRTPLVHLDRAVWVTTPMGSVPIQAVRIKGGAYVDESQDPPRVVPPQMEEYPIGALGRLPAEPVYPGDGWITWKPAPNVPKGARLLDQGDRELVMAAVFWARGQPAILPLGMGRWTGLSYEGQPVGFSVDGIPTADDRRFDRELYDLFTAFYDQVAAAPSQLSGWATSSDPKIYPSARPLFQRLYECGGYLRQLHDRKLAHGTPHIGNMMVSTAIAGRWLWWADLDAAEVVDEDSGWDQLARFLIDLQFAYSGVMKQGMTVLAHHIREPQPLSETLRNDQLLAEFLIYRPADQLFLGYFHDLVLPIYSERHLDDAGEFPQGSVALHHSSLWRVIARGTQPFSVKANADDPVVKALWQAHISRTAGAEEPAVRVLTVGEVLGQVEDSEEKGRLRKALQGAGWDMGDMNRPVALVRRGGINVVGTSDLKVYADGKLAPWIATHPQLRERMSQIIGGLSSHALLGLLMESPSGRVEAVLIGKRQGVDGWLSRAIGTNQSHRLVLVVDPAQDASSVPILPILLKAGDLTGQIIRLSDIDFAAGPIATIVRNGQTYDLYA